MKTLQQHLIQYASYHRDGRNIATHMLGIPTIVCAVAVMLSRATLTLGGSDWPLSLAFLAGFGAFYLALDVGLGLLMGALLLGVYQAGLWAAAQSTPVWLACGAGAFVVGWIVQFIGHAFEGRKPAFVDDLIGLVVGPLFVVVEALFLVGMLPRLRGQIEAHFAERGEALAGARA
jgi:uncharacterized membrane protein YGL010W